MKINRLLVLSVIGILILASCRRANSTAVSDTAVDANTPSGLAESSSSNGGSVDSASLLQELEAAVQKWESHGITSYTLRVRHSQPTWSIQIIDVTVENGQVIEWEQSCFPERNCILREIDPQSFTIDALFETARRVAALGDENIEITFTKTYGYPNAISYPDGFWNLEAFMPLEPTS